MKRVLFLLLFFIIIVVIIFSFLNFIKISKITCSSQYGICDTRIQSEITKIKNRNILQTRNDLNNLLSQDKGVTSYTAIYQPLDTFKVNIIEQKGLVAFTLKNGNFAIIDSKGNQIQEVKTTALPKLTSFINLTQEQLTYISNLMASLYTFYGVNSGQVNQDGLLIDNLRGKHVLFPLTGDSDVLLGSLSLILSRLPSVKEATTISTIDLRFKNPVLR